MREIKFRGFSCQENRWVYGDLITSPNGEFKYLQTGEIKNLSEYNKYINQKSLKENDYYFTNKVYEVQVNSIGQLTGLKDKNNKEVYEGDILTVLEVYNNKLSNYITNVIWEEGAFIIKTDNEDYYNAFLASFFDINGTRVPLLEFEIIGNMYENPALLEYRK